MSEKKTEIAFKILVYSGAIDTLITGFCSALYYSLLNIGYDSIKANQMTDDFDFSIGRHFPEIFRHKPKKRTRGCYWFQKGEKEPRIKILESEIEKLFDKL